MFKYLALAAFALALVSPAIAGTNTPTSGSNALVPQQTVRTLVSSGTAVTISNSAAETAIVSLTIPGGTLGANGRIRVRLDGTYLNNTGGNTTFTYRVKFGGTTGYADTTGNIGTSTTDRLVDGEVMISNLNSVSSQQMKGYLVVGVAPATTGRGDLAAAATVNGRIGFAPGASTANTNSNQTLEISVQLGSADANHTFALNSYSVEVIN